MRRAFGNAVLVAQDLLCNHAAHGLFGFRLCSRAVRGAVFNTTPQRVVWCVHSFCEAIEGPSLVHEAGPRTLLRGI